MHTCLSAPTNTAFPTSFTYVPCCSHQHSLPNLFHIRAFLIPSTLPSQLLLHPYLAVPINTALPTSLKDESCCSHRHNFPNTFNTHLQSHRYCLLSIALLTRFPITLGTMKGITWTKYTDYSIYLWIDIFNGFHYMLFESKQIDNLQ